MSLLQDESFPADELLDELNYTTNLNIIKSNTTTNSSVCLSSEQNLSTESSTSGERPSSELSGQTCASDPIGGTDRDNENDNDVTDSTFGAGTNQRGSNKAASYQDIHSEYTRRRFKHVVSKVGQYIAQMKAEDAQRRTGSSSKFQRAQSMPETLTPKHLGMSASTHYSADQLQQLHESTKSEGDITDASASPLSQSNVGRLLNENDRLVNENEHLQNYNDHLQVKLTHKVSEVVTLKRTVDMLRYELSDLKEKLKRQTASTTLNGSFGALKRSTLSTLNSSTTSMMRKSCATQTELITPKAYRPPPTMLVTLDSSTDINPNSYDSGDVSEQSANIGGSNRNVATIQPLSLNFSNDSNEVDTHGNVGLHPHSNGNNSTRANTGANRLATNNSGSSQPSSNDSAIEMETIELGSPTGRTATSTANQLRRQQTQQTTNSNRRAQPPLPAPQPHRRQGHFYYYDHHAKRYIALEAISLATLNATDTNVAANAPQDGDQNNNGSVVSSVVFKKKSATSSLRARMLRLFGPCARCDEPNQTINESNATYAQMPLVDKSIQSRRNFR